MVAHKPFQTVSKPDYPGLVEARLFSCPCRSNPCSERRSFLSRSQASALVELVFSFRSPARSAAGVLFPCDSWRWLVERLVRSAAFSLGLFLLLTCPSVQLTVSTRDNAHKIYNWKSFVPHLLFIDTNMIRFSNRKQLSKRLISMPSKLLKKVLLSYTRK